jgi:hypothetical protein
MRYWLDTEFIEDGKTIDLISIGIVAEDGREYYAQFVEVDYNRASPWVQDNVIAHLTSCPTGTVKFHHSRSCSLDCPWRNRDEVRRELLNFIGDDLKPQFWGYYADYDWVAVAQLFGTMMQLPKGWPMYCRDIKQLCDDLGNPQLPEQGKGEHHALADARWNRQAWQFLQELKVNA